ncbi:hypothetical protein GCM10027027_21890 [Neomicrococcus lactis]
MPKRIQLGELLKRFDAIRSLAYWLNIINDVEIGRDSAPNDRMVINDEDSD